MKRFISLLNIVLVLSMLPAACGPTPAPTEAPAPTPTPQVIEKEVPVTPTPVPPAPTPAPIRLISGRVWKVEAGVIEIFPGAEVETVETSHDKPINWTVTDGEGWFTLEVFSDGPCLVVPRHEGYVPHTQAVMIPGPGEYFVDVGLFAPDVVVGVGSEGGVVSGLDGTRVEIPPGALYEDTNITLTTAWWPPAGRRSAEEGEGAGLADVWSVPEDRWGIGGLLDLGAEMPPDPGVWQAWSEARVGAMHFGPEGLQFNEPMQIWSPMDPSLNLEEGQTVPVYSLRLQPGDNAWEWVEDGEAKVIREGDGLWLVTQTDHFSWKYKRLSFWYCVGISWIHLGKAVTGDKIGEPRVGRYTVPQGMKWEYFDEITVEVGSNKTVSSDFGYTLRDVTFSMGKTATKTMRVSEKKGAKYTQEAKDKTITVDIYGQYNEYTVILTWHIDPKCRPPAQSQTLSLYEPIGLHLIVTTPTP